jgi:hypothetical protein
MRRILRQSIDNPDRTDKAIVAGRTDVRFQGIGRAGSLARAVTMMLIKA